MLAYSHKNTVKSLIMNLFHHASLLEDRAEITDMILRLAYAMDMQDWTALRDCLANELDVDYTALRGETRRIMSADDFVEKRAKDLAGLRTQHISTNHLVSIHGDHAECTSCFLIHRVDPAKTEDNHFDTAGHYLHGLTRTANGWRIDRIRQTVLWNRGNPEIHGALRRH